MRYFNSIRISIKLPLFMGVICLVSLALMASLALHGSRSAMDRQATAKLQAVAAAHRHEIHSYFESVQAGLTSQIHNPLVADAFYVFRGALRTIEGDVTSHMHSIYIDNNPFPMGERHLYEATEDGSNYSRSHQKFHRYFVTLADSLGLADVLLVDVSGQIVYSVAKNADFAANLTEGSLQSTPLAGIFRDAIENAGSEQFSFADFSLYAPASGIRGFAGLTIFNERGQPLGVVVFSFDAQPIDEILQIDDGLGETGAAYSVGSDGYLRSNVAGIDEPTQLASRIHTVEAVSETAVSVDAGVFGVASRLVQMPLSYHGIDWTIVAEQSEEEILREWSQMRNNLALEGILALAAIAVLITMLARSLSRPLNKVGAAMREVQKANFDIDVPYADRGDEVGAIAASLDEFRLSLAETESIALDARLRGAGFENSSAAMVILNDDAQISYANASMTKFMAEAGSVLGNRRRAGDLTGQPLSAIHPKPGSLSEVLNDPQRMPFSEIVKVEERYLSIAANTVLDADGNTFGTVVEFSDVTETQMNSAMIASINAQHLVAQFSLEGNITSSNALFEALRGDSASQNLVDFMGYYDSQDEPSQGLLDCIGQNETLHDRFVFNSDAASERILDGTFSLIRDPAGSPMGILFIGTDVTQSHREVEAANERQMRMAEEQDRIVNILKGALDQLSDGDLMTSIEVEVAPEYRQLCSDFNQSVQGLREAMLRVIDNAGSIREEAVDIAGAADDLSQRTEKQAATLEQTAAALDELTSSVRSAAEGAGIADKMVHSARDNATASRTVVQEAVDAMGEIEQSSEQISRIISVIDEIAFQTNLLALNAGVEAARAGEAGRGFAVVASEVRALAQRSSDAANEINQLISSSGQQVKRGVELVGRTGEALEHIFNSVNEISTHVSDIALSAREQSTGLGEINVSVNELDRFTQQNAAMFEETTAASHALTQQAEALTQTVGQFRTGVEIRKPANESMPQQSQPSPVGAVRGSSADLNIDGNLALAVQHPEPVVDEDGWEEF